MATVLHEYTTKEQCYVVRSFVGKMTQCKDIHKDMFPVHGGKYLLSKVVHNWVEKFSQGRSKVTDDA
jgi:hypothetical protein